MSDIAALPEAQAEDLAPFLDGDQKQEIIDQQHGFLITEARPHVASTQPQFKDQVMYEIAFFVPGALGFLETKGKAKAAENTVKTFSGDYVTATCPAWAVNSKRWMLALQHNGTRQRQAAQIAELLATGNSMVGPCWMSEIPNDTPGFNPTRIIIGNPKPPTKKAKPNSSASTSTQPAHDLAPDPDESDGIPFATDDTYMVT